ncbi:MAG: hypothetical protein R3B11_17015 [Nitrospira sp.]|nr:hypothetical protein [Nitrospira sp.]MDR4474075.1 hypothetical protein [Nitrospira sp.]MDR4477688.1 hypothetical protein [Nitrospira sp.]
MDLARVLIAIVGMGASVTTYCLMRFPHMRRDKFRHYGPCSVAWSSLAALVVLCICLLVLIAQSVWPHP